MGKKLDGLIKDSRLAQIVSDKARCVYKWTLNDIQIYMLEHKITRYEDNERGLWITYADGLYLRYVPFGKRLSQNPKNKKLKANS